MTEFENFALAALRSIDATLKELLALSQARTAAKLGASVASAAELDGQYGDPVIKAKDPKDWTGDSMNGRRFSECPPAYLDLLAERYDYFAQKETDEKKAGYNRRDAARARGWAERLRHGWKPTATATAEIADSEWPAENINW